MEARLRPSVIQELEEVMDLAIQRAEFHSVM